MRVRSSSPARSRPACRARAGAPRASSWCGPSPSWRRARRSTAARAARAWRGSSIARSSPSAREMAVVELAHVPRRLAQRQAIADRRLRRGAAGLRRLSFCMGPHSKSVHMHPCRNVHMHLFSMSVKARRSEKCTTRQIMRQQRRTTSWTRAPARCSKLRSCRRSARLALPNVVVMVVQSAIGLIETWFVAKLGTDALAGMALVFPLLMVIQMISAGAMGGGILSSVARALGSNRARRRQHARLARGRDRGRRSAFSPRRPRFSAGRSSTRLMGGRDGSLAAALTYSNLVFARRDPALALQLACRRHPRHRQHDRAGERHRARRDRADPAVARADLRRRPAAAARHRRRRCRGRRVLRRRQRDLRHPICGRAAACCGRRGVRPRSAGRRPARSCASAPCRRW